MSATQAGQVVPAAVLKGPGQNSCAEVGKAVHTSFVKFFHQVIKAFFSCLVEIKLRLCLCVQRKRGIQRWLKKSLGNF